MKYSLRQISPNTESPIYALAVNGHPSVCPKKTRIPLMKKDGLGNIHLAAFQAQTCDSLCPFFEDHSDSKKPFISIHCATEKRVIFLNE